MLEIPGQRPVAGPQCHGRCRVQGVIERCGAAARPHPRLRLRHAPVGEVEIGIVGAGNPGLAPDAELIGQLAPRVAAGLTGPRDRVEFPRQHSGRGVERADPAAVVSEAVAAGEPLQHLAFDHDRSRVRRVPLGPVGNGRRPHLPAGAGVERHEMGVGRRHEHLVVVERDIPHRRGADERVRRNAMLPDQLARLRVERLDHVCRVRQEHGAAVHQRRRLVRAAVLHGPHPRQLQLFHRVARDRRERAVAPALIRAPRHQPVAGIGIAKHVGGDRHVVFHLAAHGQAGWPIERGDAALTGRLVRTLRRGALASGAASRRDRLSARSGCRAGCNRSDGDSRR